MSNFVTRVSDQPSVYILTQAEMENNAELIYNALSSYGWTLNAIAGALGNAQAESSLNPGACQQGYGVPSGSGTYYAGGLGLWQWTSTPNAILWYGVQVGSNWYDGARQCDFINLADNAWATQLDTGLQQWGWLQTGTYPISFQNYKQYAGTPEDAASIWLYNLERPADPGATESQRRSYARNWYDYLSGSTPQPPEPPDPPQPPVPTGKNKAWLYFKFDDLRRGNYERI